MNFYDFNFDDSEYFFERNETYPHPIIHAVYRGRLKSYLPYYEQTDCEREHRSFESLRRAWLFADTQDMLDAQRELRERAHTTEFADADAMLLEVLGALLN